MTCQDCGDENTWGTIHYYMVQDALWREHGVGKGQLCLDCLQGRMDRPLTLADFRPCTISIPAALCVASAELFAAADDDRRADFRALSAATKRFLDTVKRGLER